MPVKLLWTPKARADIKSIYIALARDHPQSAERYFTNFRRKAELLIQNPRLGGRHPEIFRTARMLIEAPYVILYETVPDTESDPVHTVEIIRIVDGRRDLTSLF
jgi:toxin ParE1/3/4